MDIVERLIAPGLSEHSPDADKEEAADEIVSLRARCASLEAERDGLAKALETLRDGYGPNHLSRYVRTVASKALAAYRKEAPDGPL